jgi:4-hydroxy-3-methylbut-2-enyl diphosphate reductase
MLQLVLASPRGFCAGVDRAVRIVEAVLRRHGAPVYVRHEIVHNRTVVAALASQGAVFVEDLDQVPPGAPVVFSAHGVAKSVLAEAQRRDLTYLDATCPLVSKVHREVERHYAGGGAESRHILMIGHAGHPEVAGTMGQLPPGCITLVEDEAAARVVTPPDKRHLAFVTQTTLSVDDTAAIVAILRARFPTIAGPRGEDICYATTNRQLAVKAVAASSELVLVLGAAHSSNSQRLCEAVRSCGRPAILLEDAAALDWATLAGVRRLGISAGASVPESQVEALVERLRSRYEVTIEERVVTREDVTFRLPASLGM